MNVLQLKRFNLSVNVNEYPVKILDDITLSINKGKINTIIGESGCGKSLLCKSILKLLPVDSEYSGAILFNHHDKEYNLLADIDLQQVRGKIVSLLFQNPSSSLNPVLKCGSQIIDILPHNKKASKSSKIEFALDLLNEVSFQNPMEIFHKYPHELSGGEKQRFALALAIGCKPSLLIADEPLSSLDIDLKHNFIELIYKLKKIRKMTLLWVTHDLDFAQKFSDNVFVMYCGNIVESGTVQDVFENPSHPYTQALLNSFQSLKKDRPESIRGNISSFQNLPKGCNFYPRCDYKKSICTDTSPEYSEVSHGHIVKCYVQEK